MTVIATTARRRPVSHAFTTPVVRELAPQHASSPPAPPGSHRDRAPARRTRTYGYHMAMARTQTLVQLSDELLERLDNYRAREGRSRSEVVREAIEHYLAADREAEIDRQIVEAYTRQPPEDVWAEQAAKTMIAAEPW